MSDSQTAGPSSPGTVEGVLERSLKLRDLTLIVVGTVIGSGIFIVPGAVLRQTGEQAGPALLVWFLGGVLSLLGALTYGELGAMNPKAGGLYVFVRDAFGPLTAFLYGWTMFFAISSGSLATLAVAASGYAEQLVPLGDAGRKIAALTMIAIVTAVNVRGTRHGAAVQNWATAVKVGAIAVMSAWLIGAGDSFFDDAPLWPEQLGAPLLSGIGLAMIGVLWAYEGWQYVTFSAGEAVDPQRTFPRGIVLGTLWLIAIYLLANVAYLAALGPAGAAASDAVAADAVRTLAGAGAGKLIAAAIIISMFGAANGLTLTAPRVYFAMARDGLFFAKLAAVHPGYRTPAFAILASGAWASVLALSGTFEQLLTYVVFAGWIFYALGGLSVFVYRRRFPDWPRPFKTPGYPLTPLLFVAAAAAIVLNTLFARPVQGLLGLAIVLLGAPAYYFWRRRRA
ncbi:MAG: amino acid transporter [Gemmatimonadales bacterium]|nr:Serine/threonine exchanger SteT [bacterium HR33]GIW51162.1 MAG: amino acid transporter [Gemmatimonadales bacterium]